MAPVAALHWYEVISHATQPRIQALADAVAGRADAAAVKALSAVTDFRVWSPIPDAFDSLDVVDAERGTGVTLRAELFGWMSVGMPWRTVSVESPSLAHYLADMGLPVRSTAGTPGRPILYLDVTEEADAHEFAELLGLRRVAPSPTYTPQATYTLGSDR